MGQSLGDYLNDPSQSDMTVRYPEGLVPLGGPEPADVEIELTVRCNGEEVYYGEFYSVESLEESGARKAQKAIDLFEHEQEMLREGEQD